MAYENILLERDGKIARLTLNRPAKLNALSQGLQADLDAAFREIDEDDSVSVLIVRGAGRAFCAGYDLTPPPAGAEPQRRRSISQDRWRLRQLINRWYNLWTLRKPVIAQVHGYCLAGGNELVGACDLVVAAEDAQFGHPAGRALGIPPTLGLWPLHIGMRKTKELLFTGDSITGKEAERIGMVNKAVPVDQLEAEVASLAQRIAMIPLPYLTVHKHSTNRYFEIMGLKAAIESGADFDAIYHAEEGYGDFARIAQEKGLKAALEWRDSPFADYRGAKKE